MSKEFQTEQTDVKQEERRKLTEKEIERLKNIFCVSLDTQGISRYGKLSHFKVGIADRKWESFEDAKNAVHLIVNLLAVRHRERRQTDKLIELCLQRDPVLFHDQYEIPYARVKMNGIDVTLKIGGRRFKSWIASLMWNEEKKAPGTEALHTVLNVLKAKALFEGERVRLHNRVAPTDDGIWLDMADKQWRAIKVTAAGWQIVDHPPILFKRYSHQLPLPEPKRGGDPWKFFHFVNIKPTNENTQLTLLCTIVCYLVPTIPHPILILYGVQGSGKTLFLRLIRKIIDPSVTETLTIPRNEREWVQQLDHHWCAFYDNVTNLATWMSDMLCRAITGSGFSKRELYTDDDDIIYGFIRCVGLNGINVAAKRGDLLDRALLQGLENIPLTKRRTEEELLAEFENCKAEILGGFLDTLAKAIRLYPSVKLEGLFRMADFTKWGCAVAMALGKSQKEFLIAYEEKVQRQIEEAAFVSPLAMVLMDWSKSTAGGYWEGTPSQLFAILASRAKELRISTRQKAWPKAPHILVRKLNELVPSLKSLGLEVVTGIHTGKARRITVQSVSSVKSVSHEKHEDNTTNSTNTIPRDFSETLRFEDLKAVYCVDEVYSEHKCCICGATKLTNWQAEDFKGNKLWICENCKVDWEGQVTGDDWIDWFSDG